MVSRVKQSLRRLMSRSFSASGATSSTASSVRRAVGVRWMRVPKQMQSASVAASRSSGVASMRS